MSVYEQRQKRAEAIADMAHRHDAQHASGDAAHFIDNDDWAKPRAIETVSSLHLLSHASAPSDPYADALANDNGKPLRCPMCGGPVEVLLRNYQPFTACTESLADGANCAWFAPGSIARVKAMLAATKNDDESGEGVDSDDSYSQVPTAPRADPETRPLVKSGKPASRKPASRT